MSDHTHAIENGHSHGHHPNYIKIWAVLCVLLVVSVVGPMAGIRVVTLITAFGIAIVKAYLVVKNFMHLDIEKKWVGWILLVMIAFMVVFFGGVAPDVLKQSGQRWHKTYVEPSVEPAAPGHGAEGAHK